MSKSQHFAACLRYYYIEQQVPSRPALLHSLSALTRPDITNLICSVLREL